MSSEPSVYLTGEGQAHAIARHPVGVSRHGIPRERGIEMAHDSACPYEGTPLYSYRGGKIAGDE